MKAIVGLARPHLELQDVPEPQCRSGEVVIQTPSWGICGTDLEILHGTMPEDFARYPVELGHEWKGIVEEVGPDVTKLRSGDPVSVKDYFKKREYSLWIADHTWGIAAGLYTRGRECPR